MFDYAYTYDSQVGAVPAVCSYKDARTLLGVPRGPLVTPHRRHADRVPTSGVPVAPAVVVYAAVSGRPSEYRSFTIPTLYTIIYLKQTL